MNPLFPSDDSASNDPPQKDPGFVLKRQEGHQLQPMAGYNDRLSKPAAEAQAKDKDATQTAAPQPVLPVANPSAPQSHHGKPAASDSSEANPAVELIRQKVNALYAAEPAAAQELTAVKNETPPRSKHEQFMYELSTSGKSLAHIQTAWHNYYVALPEHEKHQVWQEFYENNARRQTTYRQLVEQQQLSAQAPAASSPPPEMPGTPQNFVIVSEAPEEPRTPSRKRSRAKTPVAPKHGPATAKAKDRRDAARLRRQILAKARLSEQAQVKARQHLRSLVFGLATGIIVLVVFLFGFFNEVIIAPFIQPSRHVTSTPIILTSNDITATSAPEVVIPKINVEIPVNYGLTTDDENTIENALEGGVVHYPSTVMPGQQGNAAFFGHSSNNIFNPGQYKFAFVLLHTLLPGDLFYLTYNGTVYTYRVYDKKIVSPDDVAVLSAVPGKTATATLITCDPPGTSINRLVVWGEQISPDPSGNSTTTTTPVTATTPQQLASNGPTLWSRFIHWLF